MILFLISKTVFLSTVLNPNLSQMAKDFISVIKNMALNNIKERLEMMFKGKLTISPREGGGTSVKITIPQTDR